MNVLLRADAGVSQGTGHVMRCLTLAEALAARRHSVTLMGHLGGVQWLVEAVDEAKIPHIECRPDEIDVNQINELGFDWVGVDSYSIPPEQISLLNSKTPCLAVVDGDARGISADLYLDQNLGTKLTKCDEIRDRLLAGSSYALIRDAVLEHRRLPESTPAGRLRVAAFMGGTDPLGVIVAVARSIAAEDLDIELDLVSSKSSANHVRAAVAALPHARVLEPTRELPAILGRADVVVSAAGTSAWDICAMARPSVFIALVDNQRDSLAAAVRAQLALAIDATSHGGGSPLQAGPLVAALVKDQSLRLNFSQRCWDEFDGLGKVRVVEAMERKNRA